ncbi:extracellular solute-binding protein [Martelella limonii]|uniref:extracellular solute-binding protein n=1 Tax=Martelella limonii TaxID=1647649 RepID=UPI001580046E|nr:extracellular solute-binding protein [Martelella limonii]
MTARFLATTALAGLFGLIATGAMAEDLSLLVDNSPDTVAIAKALTDAYTAAHPDVTFSIGAIQQNDPDFVKDVGFFAQPGDDPDHNGLTVWMPSAYYVAKGGDHVDTAKDFVNFVASQDSCDIMTKTVGASGPYLINGCTLPDDVPPAVADMLPYFQDSARNAPALEFLSPVKGPGLEQITVEVGTGIRDAESGAALYDRDVEKQAKQLRLPNW